jgi:hypothetical protein
MKQKIIFIIGIFLLVGIAIAIMRVVSLRTPAQGDLRVDATPTADVYVDGSMVGRTPFGKTPYKISTGEHTLKISASDDGSGKTLVDYETKVVVSQDAKTYVNATLSESQLTNAAEVVWMEQIRSKNAELALYSDPDAASILVDEELKGMTTSTITNLPPGEHSVSLVSKGYMPRTTRIKLTPGYRVHVMMKLTLSPGGTNDQASPTPEVNQSTPSANLSTTPPKNPTTTVKVTPKTTITQTPTSTQKSTSTDPAKPFVIIKETPTNDLNVRKGPSKTEANSEEKPKVYPGEKYSLLDEQSGWYQIKTTATASGWISATYAEKVE